MINLSAEICTSKKTWMLNCFVATIEACFWLDMRCALAKTRRRRITILRQFNNNTELDMETFVIERVDYVHALRAIGKRRDFRHDNTNMVFMVIHDFPVLQVALTFVVAILGTSETVHLRWHGWLGTLHIDSLPEAPESTHRKPWGDYFVLFVYHPLPGSFGALEKQILFANCGMSFRA